jgi:hypothetical protein
MTPVKERLDVSGTSAPLGSASLLVNVTLKAVTRPHGEIQVVESLKGNLC